MNTLREVMQQALEWAHNNGEAVFAGGGMAAVDRMNAWSQALRAALAEPDEPIAWAMPRSDGLILDVICPEEHARMPGQYTVPLYAHPYDQTALELCEVCGWKTLIPTEGCLNCERQPKAEQEPVGTYEEVMQTMRSLQTGTLEQQQAFALLKDKPLYAEPQPKAEQEPVNIGPEWTPCVKLPVTVHVRHQRPGETHVSTREGITPVKPDDLIMRGVSGEEYPIGREIFERTYQLGEAPQPKAEQEPVADGYYVMQVDGKAKKIWPMTEEQALVVAAHQPKAWYGVSPMFGTVTFDSYQDALDAGFDNPLPLIEAAVWGDGK
jgi:hypothetical protein